MSKEKNSFHTLNNGLNIKRSEKNNYKVKRYVCCPSPYDTDQFSLLDELEHKPGRQREYHVYEQKA